jgi:peptidoglycan/xylan/chitin deacetylase (PgdA/CDA1 family)
MRSVPQLLASARRWADRHHSSGVIILMYHRIAEVAVDPWGLSVSPANFAAQLEVLRRVATPLRLRDLPIGPAERSTRRNAVVVTFDDGYVDALHAESLLKAHDIPATLFVTTGNIGTNREFWWDRLSRILLSPGELPASLELTIGSQARHWRLGAAAASSADARHPDGARHAFHREIWEVLLRTSAEEREELVSRLGAWAGDRGAPSDEARTLTADEIESLDRGGLMEIGAHTVRHPQLPALPAGAQRREITQSRDTLTSIVGHPITSFSYPHGEYDRTTVKLVKEAGFSRACTVEEANVRLRGDPLRLPRYGVRDWPGDRFEERLRGWLGPA